MKHDNLSRVMDALQLSELKPEEQEALLLELNSLIFEGSLARIVESMDEQTRTDFEVLLDRDAMDEEMEAFLLERAPGADALIEETIQELTDDILSGTDTK